MTLHLRPVLFLLAVVSALCAASPAGAQPSAEELFRQGREAVQKKDWRRAHEALIASWALKRSFDTAALLGQAELKLGKHRDAAEHLDFALRNFPNLDPAPDAKQRIEDATKAARAKVLALRVEVNVAGAEITVDDAPVGRSPLDTELFVEPGAHLVTAKLEGYAASTQEIQGKAGSSNAVRLELAKAASAPPAASAGAAGAPSSGPGGDSGPKDETAGEGKSSTKTILLISGGALTAVSLGVGIGFGLDSKSASSDADDLSAKLGANGCSGGANSAACTELRDTRDRANRNATISTVGLIGAGVFGAATAAVWFAWPDARSTTGRAPRTQLAPLLGSTRGVVLRGSF